MNSHPFFRRISVAGLFVAFMAHAVFIHAQTNISINATGVVAHPSAILDVSSTNSGLLLPRMTHDQKMAIVNPANGLMIYQIGGGDGIWYYDTSSNGGEWVALSRYLGGRIEMGDAPSTVAQGAGYTVTRLTTGTDEITLNEPFQYGPNVIVSSSQSDGSAPFLEDYCKPEFVTCGCRTVMNVQVYSTATPSAFTVPGDIIQNWESGCNTEPNRYKYYLPGDPVYSGSGVPDLCQGSPTQYSMRYRGNPNAICGSHSIFVYIDWQQDGFYDEMDDLIVEAIDAPWNSGNQIAPDLPIPASAFSGDTFMRVMALEGTPSNNCHTADGGETEEYNIHVSCGVDAVYQDVASYCNVGDITPNSFRISCRRVGGEPRNVQNYYVQINENDN